MGVNVTVPAVEPELAHEIVAGSGCRTAKVKVAEPGQAEADDVERVAAVRDAIGPDGRIRVDANGGWSVDQAARMLGQLARYGLEYAEQPCATPGRARRAASRASTCRWPPTSRSARPATRSRSARPAPPTSSCSRSRRSAASGRRWRSRQSCGLPVVVSSAVETSVGLAAGVALAAALPELRYDCGLATMSLLTGDVTADPLAEAGGKLPRAGHRH